MLNIFKKNNESADFNATKNFMSGMLLVDEERKLIKVKGNKDLIPFAAVQTYSLSFGNKTYNRANLGKAIVGGAVFGLAGVVLAGTHTDEYISNIKIMIKANNKYYYLPLTIGKIKASAAKGILNSAEGIIAFLDSISNE